MGKQTNYENCTVEELKGIIEHLDKEKYPERYTEITKIFNEKQSETVQSEPLKLYYVIGLFLLSFIVWNILPNSIQLKLYTILYSVIMFFYIYLINPILSLFGS